MKSKPAVIWLGLSVFATVISLCAQDAPAQAFEVSSTERITFPAGGAVRLTGSYGYLSVDGWDEPEVEVTITKFTGRLYKPKEREEAKRRLELIRVVTERRSETELSITTLHASRHGTWSPPLPPTTMAGVTVEYRIHVPRTSRLVVHHDKGYVWVSDVAGDIEVTSHTGDMILMLPGPGPYAIDAKTRMGSIDSDFEGSARKEHLTGTGFTRPGHNPSPRVRLRIGRGNITIKQSPPAL